MSRGRNRRKRAMLQQRKAVMEQQAAERIASLAAEEQRIMKDHGATGVRTLTIMVTPEKAAAWLKLNVKNRAIKKYFVERYKKDFISKQWAAIGDPIRFNKEGRMMDGQHRLTAIVATGVSVKMQVCVGIEPEAFAYIDSGARRVASDVLRMEGVSRAPAVAAVVNTVAKNNTTYATQLTAAQNRDIYLTDPSGYDEAAEASRQANKITMASSYGAFYYVASKKYPEEVRSFHREFVSGIGDSVGFSAIRVVRDHLMTNYPPGKRAGYTTQADIAIKIAWAFNRWLANMETKVVKLPKNLNKIVIV